MNLLIVDTETTGLDPEVDYAIEVGAILYDVEKRTVLSNLSFLPSFNNDADHISGLPVGDLNGMSVGAGINAFRSMVESCDFMVAHNAEFDKAFTSDEDIEFLGSEKSWLCTMNDFVWPKKASSKRLVDIALAHGVPVFAAHRALDDCSLIARLFTAMGDALPSMVDAAIARSGETEVSLIANVSYNNRNLAKEAGFRWEPSEAVWTKKVKVSDVKDHISLGFSVGVLES